jgi:hypothetical protein
VKTDPAFCPNTSKGEQCLREPGHGPSQHEGLTHTWPMHLPFAETQPERMEGMPLFEVGAQIPFWVPQGFGHTVRMVITEIGVFDNNSLSLEMVDVDTVRRRSDFWGNLPPAKRP